MSNPDLDPVTSKTTNTDITAIHKIEGFHKLIDNANTAMLVTRCKTGALHSRAMTPCRPIEPIQISLFFIANQASHKFDELEYDSNVNVSFYDQKTTGWASVSGVAKVSHSKELIKKFWSPKISSFFVDLKDGEHDGTKNDPRVCVIEVVPNEIRYWVSTSSTIGRTAKVAYGALTGNAKAPGEFRIISDAEIAHARGLNK